MASTYNTQVNATTTLQSYSYCYKIAKKNKKNSSKVQIEYTENYVNIIGIFLVLYCIKNLSNAILQFIDSHAGTAIKKIS